MTIGGTVRCGVGWLVRLSTSCSCVSGEAQGGVARSRGQRRSSERVGRLGCFELQGARTFELANVSQTSWCGFPFLYLFSLRTQRARRPTRTSVTSDMMSDRNRPVCDVYQVRWRLPRACALRGASDSQPHQADRAALTCQRLRCVRHLLSPRSLPL